MADRFWRFVHMISHIPLGFGAPSWAINFHDWTARKWMGVSPQSPAVTDSRLNPVVMQDTAS
jgi:ABC-type multidrug transport system permease subunit